MLDMYPLECSARAGVYIRVGERCDQDDQGTLDADLLLTTDHTVGTGRDQTPFLQGEAHSSYHCDHSLANIHGFRV